MAAPPAVGTPSTPPAGRGVLCVGDLMVDVLARLSGPIEPGSDRAGRISWQSGGSAANTACWLVAAGTPAGFVGRVGDDAPGHGAVDQLKAAGVVPHVGVTAGVATGTCVVLVDPDGERAMVPDPGANLTLSVADLPPLTGGHGPGYRHVHLSAYTLIRPETRPVAQAVLGWARQAGLTTSVDAASAAPLRPLATDLLAWMRGIDLLLVNLDEARALTAAHRGTDADEPADRCALALAQTAREVVVKLGRDGAVWARAGAVLTEPTEPVEPVDTTGAGDAFDAGFVAAWLAGDSPAECLRAGHRLGARAVSQVGARPALGGVIGAR